MSERSSKTVFIPGVGDVRAVLANHIQVGAKVLLAQDVTATVSDRRGKYLGLSLEISFRTEHGKTYRQTFAAGDLIALA